MQRPPGARPGRTAVLAQCSGRCRMPQSGDRAERSNATYPSIGVSSHAGSCIFIRHRYILCRVLGPRSPKTAHAAAVKSFHPPFWMRASENLDSEQLMNSLSSRLLTWTRVLGLKGKFGEFTFHALG